MLKLCLILTLALIQTNAFGPHSTCSTIRVVISAYLTIRRLLCCCSSSCSVLSVVAIDAAYKVAHGRCHSLAIYHALAHHSLLEVSIGSALHLVLYLTARAWDI